MPLRTFGTNAPPLSRDTWLFHTDTFSVNNLADPEPITVATECRHVIIGEDPSVTNWPTTDYQIKGASSNNFVQCAAGTKFEFHSTVNEPPFRAGQVIGYVQTVSGSTTFMKVEQ